MVSETSDNGYPVASTSQRQRRGEIHLCAPSKAAAFLLTGRGGDYELRLGKDLSIRLPLARRDTVQMYFRKP